MTKNKGQFTSEQMKGNQFAKGNLPNKTSFKKGESVGGKHPQWKGGIQKHERDGVHLYTGYQKKRIRQSRVVYEARHGVIPKGWVIYHTDGNRFNDHIDNLEAISRGELMNRNHKKHLQK